MGKAEKLREQISGGLLGPADLQYGYDPGGRRMIFSASLHGQAAPPVSFYYSPTGRTSRVSVLDSQHVDYAYVPGSDFPDRREVVVGETRLLTSQHLYDAKGNLAAVQNMRHNGTPVASHFYTVDALNRRTDAVREDGTNWVYGYNERSEVTSAQKRDGATPLAGMRREYTYDHLGNRKTAKEGGNSSGSGLRTITYTRDSLNQPRRLAGAETDCEARAARKGEGAVRRRLSQYTQITRTSRAVDFVGTTTPASSDLTVNDAYPERQGAWWRAEVGPQSGQLWAEAAVRLDGNLVDEGLRLAPSYHRPGRQRAGGGIGSFGGDRVIHLRLLHLQTSILSQRPMPGLQPRSFPCP